MKIKRSNRKASSPPLYDPYFGLYTRQEIKKIKNYMDEEMHRSLLYLQKKDVPRVYYLGYLFRNVRQEKIFGRLGAIGEHSIHSQNTVFCDLRVGSYRYDNVTNGGLGDDRDREEASDFIFMPAEIQKDSFQYSLWKLTDSCYREAAEQYYERKSRELHYVDPNRSLPAKKKNPPVTYNKYKTIGELDADYWKYLIRKAGLLVKKYKNIKNSWVEFNCSHRQNILVNSEGADIIQQNSIYELRAFFWLLNSKGEGIEQDLTLIEGDIHDLPDEKEFLRIIQNRIDILLSLDKAYRLNAYSGPVLLSPDSSGLFFHEVIGHRLEGSRLLSPEEGGTFRDLRGKLIAPDYIDIIDDPTLAAFQGRKMIGHFLYDDEGSEAKRVVLVEGGILKNFLTTSTPLPGQKDLNGHARNQRFERPISRMGNLFITNRKPVSKDEMWQLFIEEIKRQKKPFGIYVEDTLGGETGTTHYDFQAFKGEIMLAYRVFPDGRKEPVRGVDFVGTPLSALDSVMCMGDDPSLDNSYCGAESGIVPVSTISPSMLMRNMELQARDRERYTPYAIPLPYK